MIITFNNKTFKYPISSPLLNEFGIEISSDLYDVEGYEFEDATWVDKFTFSLDEGSTTTFELGDEIVIDVNGFEEKNIIVEINPTDLKYKVAKVISILTSTIQVKKNFALYTPTGLTNDTYYFFNTNESIYISNRFASVMIPYRILSLRNNNLISMLKEYETEAFNNEADNSIYGDLSYLGNPYKIIDIGQYRELKILKILALVESSRYKNEISARTDYDNYLKKVVNVVKISDTGVADVKKSLYGSWDITFGG